MQTKVAIGRDDFRIGFFLFAPHFGTPSLVFYTYFINDDLWAAGIPKFLLALAILPRERNRTQIACSTEPGIIDDHNAEYVG